MISELIGLFGAFFILSAWFYETYRAFKKGDKLNIKFILIYIAGISLLTYHSLLINDTTFIILNGTILILSFVELDIAMRKKKKRR